MPHTRNRRRNREMEPAEAPVAGRMSQARETAMDTFQQTEDWVRNRPGSSTLMTFGIGFGLGLALSLMLTPIRQPPTWRERHFPRWS